MPSRADCLRRYLRGITSQVGPASDDDALLGRFLATRDAAAFEELVGRHGPTVLRVCRRLLGNTHDADDAFQATFLVLARKAASVRPAGALAAWLHGVACRVALGARAAAARRRQREGPAPDLEPPDPRPDPLAELTAREALQVLDEEVRRLPEAYRLPVVLCCLEGLSQEEAARQLGWSPGSVKGRLERGRKHLHRRLARRGLSLAAALALAEVARFATAGPSGALTAAAARAVASAGVVPARVAALAEGGLKSLSLVRAKVGLFLPLAAGVIAAGAGTLARQVLAGKRPEGPVAGQPGPRKEPQARTDRHGDPLPDGVLARLGTVRLRAAGALVGLSPDGKTIVTVARGRQVKYWDADTGSLRGRRELPIQISDESFLSPDGRLLVVREPDFDMPIDVWDVTSGKRLLRLRAPKGTGIVRAAFSPDGKTLAVSESGASHSGLRLWDMSSGAGRLLKGHTRPPEALAFSPDGKRLAASDGHHLICWETAGGEQLWQERIAFNNSLAFTPDGRAVIASPGHRERAWHAWDAVTGKKAEGLKLPEGHNYARLSVAPDGRALVFVAPPYVQGEDGRVRLWDLRAGKLLRTLPVAGAVGPFAPDGRSFLTHNGALQRWELATGRPLLPDTTALGHRLEVGRVVYSPDGRLLASASSDGTIRLWEVATARPLHVLRGHTWGANEIAFTPDGKSLVTDGGEGELRVWDVGSGKEVRAVPLRGPRPGEKKKQQVCRFCLTPDGRTAVVLAETTGGGGGVLEYALTGWGLTTGRGTTPRMVGPSDGLYSAFSADGRLLASRGTLLDTATGKERVKLEGPLPFGHYAFSPDGRLVAGLITRTETDGARFSTKGDHIQLWDAATGREGRRLVTGWVGQLAFSPDGRYLAAADLDGLRLWELATGEVVLRHKAHERTRGSYGHSFASCLAFAPDGRALATGHLDSTILLWGTVPAARALPAGGVSGYWDELISPDAGKAYAASWRLTDAPDQALPFLRKRLRPATSAPAETTRALLADLDSGEFRQREAAALRLGELGDRARGALREALRAGPSLDKKRRLEALLKATEGPPSGEALREMRGVAVLERVGPVARGLLKELAAGDPALRLTREAMASLGRLASRPATAP